MHTDDGLWSSAVRKLAAVTAVLLVSVVAVPAGVFSAVPVEVIHELPNGEVRRTRYWYSPGVGNVKSDLGSGVEVVLKTTQRLKYGRTLASQVLMSRLHSSSAPPYSSFQSRFR